MNNDLSDLIFYFIVHISSSIDFLCHGLFGDNFFENIALR